MGTSPPPTYEIRLLRAYEGEVLGEEFFKVLAEKASERNRIKLLNLAHIEAVVARAVLPLVVSYELSPESEELLKANGRREAEQYLPLIWTDFAIKLRDSLDPYLQEFRDIINDAPESDMQLVQLLYDHEAALIDFAHAEGETLSDGDVYLQDFMEKYKSIFCRDSGM